MFTHSTRWYLGASWILLVLLTFWAVDASSARSVLLATLAGIVPPVIMLTLWPNGPALTIAEVLHGVEAEKRS